MEPFTFIRSNNGPLYKQSRTFERSGEEACTVLIKVDKENANGEWLAIGPFPESSNFDDIKSTIGGVDKTIKDVQEYCKEHSIKCAIQENGIYLLKFWPQSATSLCRITIDPDPGGGRIP
ncbi:MAG TPA: hypothetical protein VF378_05440 [Geothrix sp.]